MLFLKKKPKRFVHPAEYGTIERQIRIANGELETSTQHVVLREAIDLPFGLQNYVRYKAVSERVLVQESKETILEDGTSVLIPAQYKTVTKRVQDGFTLESPSQASSLVRFFSKRDVRHKILEELRSDYQEEQLFHFGITGANIWYWKEVTLLLTGALLRSPFKPILDIFFQNAEKDEV